MPAGGHSYRSYLFWVETALFRLAAHHAHGTLAVLPGCLVKGKIFRPRGAVYEIDALHAKFCQFFVPHLDQLHIAAVVIAASGNQDHTRPVGVDRLLEPL